MTDPSEIIDRAADAIRTAEALLICAGAGMGVDSGLPDFRGPEGFWRAYPAAALIVLGAGIVVRGIWRQRRGIGLPVTRAAKGAAMTRALRSVLTGLATVGIGVAWWAHLDLLLMVALVIGGEELLETSVVIAALDDAERRGVWAPQAS